MPIMMQGSIVDRGRIPREPAGLVEPFVLTIGGDVLASPDYWGGSGAVSSRLAREISLSRLETSQARYLTEIDALSGAHLMDGGRAAGTIGVPHEPGH
jgi:hypothetical protein